MVALLKTIDLALNLYMWVVIANIIYSWLYAFNVINSSNQFVNTLGRVLYQLTEPVLAPIRRFVPTVSGIDFSPVILFLIIYFIRVLIWETFIPMFARSVL